MRLLLIQLKGDADGLDSLDGYAVEDGRRVAELAGSIDGRGDKQWRAAERSDIANRAVGADDEAQLNVPLDVLFSRTFGVGRLDGIDKLAWLEILRRRRGLRFGSRRGLGRGDEGRCGWRGLRRTNIHGRRLLSGNPAAWGASSGYRPAVYARGERGRAAPSFAVLLRRRHADGARQRMGVRDVLADGVIRNRGRDRGDKRRCGRHVRIGRRGDRWRTSGIQIQTGLRLGGMEGRRNRRG